MIKKTFSHCWFLYSVSILAALLGSIVDLIIISNFLDDLCVAATGVAAPLFFLYIAIASLFYSGGLTRISYHLGKYDSDMANRIYTRTLIWGSIAGIFLSAAGLLFPEQLSIMLGADALLLPLAATYVRGLSCGAIPIILISILFMYATIAKAEKMVSLAIFLICASNIAGDLFCVYYDLGLAGIALCTAVSYWIGFLCFIRHFSSRNCPLQFARDPIPSKERHAILKLGLRSVMENISDFLRPLVCNHLLTSTGIAAFAIQNNFTTPLFALLTGATQASLLLNSLFVGERNKNSLLLAIRYALKFSLICGLALGFLTYDYAPFFCTLYDIESEEIFAKSITAIRWFALSYVFLFLNTTLITCYQSTKQSGTANLFSLLHELLLPIFSVLILAMHFGDDGIWMSVVISEMIFFPVILIYAIKTLGHFPHSLEELLHLPKKLDFAIELTLEIPNAEKKISMLTEHTQMFLMRNDISKRLSNYVALCLEEMAVNIMTEERIGKKPAVIFARIVVDHSTVLLRLSYSGGKYDPFDVIESKDLFSNIGIRLVKNLAARTVYQYTMDQNYILVELSNSDNP